MYKLYGKLKKDGKTVKKRYLLATSRTGETKKEFHNRVEKANKRWNKKIGRGYTVETIRSKKKQKIKSFGSFRWF